MSRDMTDQEFEAYLVENNYKIVWRFTPSAEETSEPEWKYEGIALEYVVIDISKGCIDPETGRYVMSPLNRLLTFSKYDRGWCCGPSDRRPIIAKLLQQLGIKLGESK